MQDGWVSVGDIAQRDDEGYLYIIDRKKDMIISGGINVYPREIENVLMEHPAIVECAVFGLTDDDWGESIHCAMVCRANTTGEALAEWLDQRVARFKIPKFFHPIEELPRNGSGKILKRVLAEQFGGQQTELFLNQLPDDLQVDTSESALEMASSDVFAIAPFPPLGILLPTDVQQVRNLGGRQRAWHPGDQSRRGSLVYRICSPCRAEYCHS